MSSYEMQNRCWHLKQKVLKFYEQYCATVLTVELGFEGFIPCAILSA